MKKIFKTLLMSIAVLLPTNSYAEADTLDIDKISAALKSRVTHGDAVGVIVGIIDNDRKYIISAGQVSKPNGAAPNEQSLFEIGSITKTFTGILLADMVLKGEVKLDDPAEMYLPEGVTLPTYEGKKITLLNLATHTSALPRMPENFTPKDMTNPYADYTVQNMYDYLSAHKLTRTIGDVAAYSNLGAGLLGHIMALKAGLSYEETVKQRILTPLGMHDTSITISDQQKPRFTTGHDAAGEPTPYWDLPTLAGAGALRSNIHDMMLYLSANMGRNKTPLTPALEFSHKTRHSFGVLGMEIGLHWVTKSDSDKTVVWHNGGTGGYRTFTGFDQKNNRGVVVLSNSNDNSDAIGWAVLNNDIATIVAEAPKVILSKGKIAELVGEGLTR
ncbi:MAG: serine hydrolase [Alphaproteobacteria bacterium]|nr:MAG: serine hydrolase [Alphaproteobacteria bacterium]